jgi:tetratricopeptide (TPR) repeat protein
MGNRVMKQGFGLGLSILVVILNGCGPTVETPRTPTTTMGRDDCYRVGHQYYLESKYDSAVALLQRAQRMDSTYVDPVRDLAQAEYEWAMQSPEKSRERADHLRAARTYYVRLDLLGERASEIYERLCEISISLNDDRAFVRYAKKDADIYPYDRQLFNLARAYFEVEDFQSVIKSTRESIERFKGSPYVTSYYRLLGRAYMKIGRDQTAEKTLAAGVREADARLAELRRQGSSTQAADQLRRTHDDKVNMLLALKQLHTTYKADDKLRQVERQLKEEGYDK